MASNYVKYLNDANFESEISKGIVLVDFYADWCGPCRMIAPIIEELASEMSGKIVVAKVDTDQSQAVAANYEVTSIPTLILFVNGEAKKRIVGVKDIDFLRKMIESVL